MLNQKVFVTLSYVLFSLVSNKIILCYFLGIFSTGRRDDFGGDFLAEYRKREAEIHSGGNEHGDCFHFMLLDGKLNSVVTTVGEQLALCWWDVWVRGPSHVTAVG
jgi:hypothetical protein